jgi:hypothetical protein
MIEEYVTNSEHQTYYPKLGGLCRKLSAAECTT